MDKIKKLYFSNYFLIAFDFLKEDKVFGAFLNLLKTILNSNNFEENISSYFNFISKLYEKQYEDFSKYLGFLIKNSSQKNLYKDYASDKELDVIKNFANLSCEEIFSILKEKFSSEIDYISQMPIYKNSEFTIKKEELNSCYDIFGCNRAFVFDEDFNIKPVKIVEDIKFSDLKGYVEQKKVLYENTQSFIKGSKVNNILLYGDAGCGKSSSVRALLNEFEEIKIVQIFKNNLINLGELYKKLDNLPYKFIIFADDISFVDSDDNFSTMKAILEGSLIQCPKNAVIYATSNRKHMIRESFQARVGDEIHLKDTINELTSLSERFGINLLFQKPNQKEFIEIMTGLAQDNNIEINDSLIEKAKRFALLKGSMSPRTAKQFIDNVKVGISV